MSQVITAILLDGNPKGLRLIEISNWSGLAFVVPRSKLKEFKARDDTHKPGIYFLFGEGETKPTAYIGQSENVVDRLFTHDSNRKDDEWNEAVVFIRTLDSTLIKYLESNAIYFAKQANRYEIFNSADPKRNKLSEAQKISATEYLEKIKIIVGLFGYPIFQEVPTLQEAQTVYSFQRETAHGKGTLLDSGEFVVYKGSTARVREVKGFANTGRAALRQTLEIEGVLKREGELFVFAQDQIFTSPSAAADTIAGGSVNGWIVWKDASGKTLDENKRK